MSETSARQPFPSRELLESQLAEAIGRGEIVAFYQPQLDVGTGRVVSIEALCRWTHPIFGLIPPTDFVPIAESTGLIHRMGALILEDSCRCAADWQQRGLPIEISVNVSASQLSRESFFDHVVAIIEEVAIDPSSLTLEITESEAILDLPTVTMRLDRLRHLGIGISIDDFGTGFSSIDQLFALGASELKIDRTLMQDVAENSRSLVAAVVSLVHERHVRVVAEGIETSAHLAFAREIHADRVQGFLFGQPGSRAELEELLLV
jgi:EAL domain-containing protein (putative c-di-GMP-specific phosphodiesterase class I)